MFKKLLTLSLALLSITTPLLSEEHSLGQQQAAPSSKDMNQTTTKNDERLTIAEATAKDGAKIEIKVNSLEYSMFEINGRGFQPHESLTFISNSCQEILHFSVTADEKGNITPVSTIPAVLGFSGGTCRIDVLRAGGPIRVKFPWGTEALKSAK